MAQGILPFQYQEEKVDEGMTAHAGLLIYLELFQAPGIGKSLDANLGARGDQGFSDSQMGLAFILVNLAGGECVDDLEILEKDKGFCRALGKVETHGLSKKMRRTRTTPGFQGRARPSSRGREEVSHALGHRRLPARPFALLRDGRERAFWPDRVYGLARRYSPFQGGGGPGSRGGLASGGSRRERQTGGDGP